MRDLDSAALDRWITGNYGLDQFRCGTCGGEHEDEETCPAEDDSWAEAWWDEHEDRVMEERRIDSWDA